MNRYFIKRRYKCQFSKEAYSQIKITRRVVPPVKFMMGGCGNWHNPFGRQYRTFRTNTCHCAPWPSGPPSRYISKGNTCRCPLGGMYGHAHQAIFAQQNPGTPQSKGHPKVHQQEHRWLNHGAVTQWTFTATMDLLLPTHKDECFKHNVE